MANVKIPNVPSGCYVYEVIVGGVVRYVGKGTRGRFKNHISTARRYERYLQEGRQISLSPFYQKLLIELARGSDVAYSIIAQFEKDEAALAKEIEYIASFPSGQLWNDGPGGNGGTSNGALRRWADKAERAAHKQRLIEAWSDPEVRKRHREKLGPHIFDHSFQSKTASVRWSRPGEREKMSEFAKKTRAAQTAKKKANLANIVLSFGA